MSGVHQRLTDRRARIIIYILTYVYTFHYDHEENLWMW